LYRARDFGTVAGMYTTPRTDEWEPWIFGALCLIVALAGLAVHFLR
jgi:hypothetical protein